MTTLIDTIPAFTELMLSVQESKTISTEAYVVLVPELETEATWDHVVDTQLVDVPEAIQTQLKQQGALFKYKASQGSVLHVVHPEQHYKQTIVLGMGKKANSAKIIGLAAQIYKLCQEHCTAITLNITALDSALIKAFLLQLHNAAYAFNAYRTEFKTATLAQVQLVGASVAQLKQDVAFIHAVHQGQNLAKHVANQPANVCYPESVAEAALALAQRYPHVLNVKILDEAQMQELGMNTFLSVSKGSERPGRLVIIEYGLEKSTEKPIALIGKGVTFDTGGISLKPAAGMDEMKFDMAGAASVLGVMHALCVLQLNIPVVGALALAENMPSGRASRPGDIVKSMSGQTIEILNTDAEGRLVLCDTLTYMQRYEPKVMVDIATLTGACVVALGKVVSGLFSTDDALANSLIQAGEQVFDRTWRMPVWDDYQELLDSPCADIANIGGPTAGSITAACFLQRFTKGQRWAHLDIAGISHVSGAQKGATGRPVPLLMQFLANTAAS